ncbi:MAG: DsbA family protein [Herpetosiphonaceae bacterium]|nr:DsbA family protein [Herpetosiphonaceae bacterium]
MDRRILVALMVVLLAGCGSLEAQPATSRPTVFIPTRAPAVEQPTNNQSQAEQFPRLEQAVEVVPATDLRALGDPNAPVTIIEYSDFQCPFCLRHVQQVFPELKAKYIDTGQVRYVFRNFIAVPQHYAAPAAAVASVCAAEQGQFWPFHDELFLTVEQWSFNPITAPGSFSKYAKALDLDLEKFDACQNNPDISDQVQAESQAAGQLGIEGTPGFFVGQYYVNGAQPLAAFDQAIALAQEDAK